MSKPGRELLESAWQLRWRVPELALLLGNRATSLARETGDVEQRLRAEFIALFAANRLGRSVAGVERALAALRDAEQAGLTELLDQLRVELACCARSSGSQDVASRVLQPLLEREGTPPLLRAHALLELCGALPMYRRSSERVEALDEAERLYAAEASHDQDTVRLLRARVDAARAGHHRGHGELKTAVDSAARGIDFLERLADPAADSGGIRAGLVLEQAQALLDLGRHGEAVRCSTDLLQQPLRAAAAAPVGWLRLALTTRVYLPAGQRQAALESLSEALGGARRHELLDLQAAVLNILSSVHESAAELREALQCVREAYSADYRRRTMIEYARVRLLERFPHTEQEEYSIPRQQSVGDVNHTSSEHTVSTRRIPEPAPVASEQQTDTRQTARRLMETLVKHGGISNDEELAEAVGEGFARTPTSRHGPSGGARPAGPSGGERGDESSAVATERPADGFGTTKRERGGGGRRRRDRSERESVEPSGVTEDLSGSGRAARHDPEARRQQADPSVAPRPEERPVEGTPAAGTAGESTVFSHDATEHGRYFAAPANTENSTDANRPVREDGVERDTFPPPERGHPSAGETTTILPVVPWEPAAEAPGRSDSVPNRQGWADEDPVSGSTSPASEYGNDLHVPGSGEERWSEETRPTPAGTEGQDRDAPRAEPQEREEPAGRRSSGRSFAEIKAALDAEKRGVARDRDQQGHSGITPESGRGAGGRRRRAEPTNEDADVAADTSSGDSSAGDSEERQPVHPAVTEELLEQSRDLIKDLPELDSTAGRVDDTDQAGLADLLAEALVAYQHGKQETGEDDEHDSAGSAREWETPGAVDPQQEEIPSEGGTRARADGESHATEEPRSRRRHAAGDDGGENAYTWTPQIR